MKIQLSDHFTFEKLIKFVLPTVVMMVFTSIYGVVDGFFVSNYAGKTAFAAVNLIMPFVMGIGSLGFMIGTGGAALVGKTLGEGDRQKANEIFTMLVVATIVIGTALAIPGTIFIRKIAILMGADESMLQYCVIYGGISVALQVPFMLQGVFQCLFVTAEKPKLSLKITLAAGFSNMLLDALFLGLFKWGVVGAAVATAISQGVGGLIPLVYFARNNSSLLRFTRFKFNLSDLLTACGNGASELMTNLSMSIVNTFYNLQLMKFLGQNGVAAYGVIMYVNFVFVSIFIGYSWGVAPVISYHFGADNKSELKNLFRKSVIVIVISSLVLFVISLTSADLISKIFVGYDNDLSLVTSHAFRIYAISYLIVGFNIFSSALFTALNNGKVSATISFLRTLLFQILSIQILPLIFDVDGIWSSIIVAELLALFVSIFFVVTKNHRYGYCYFGNLE